MTQQTTPSGQNTITFQNLMDTATQLGTEAGKGTDTQIRFGLKLVEGAYHGAIDLDKNKHGTEIDDATKLAEAYTKAQGGAVIFDTKAANTRKLVSCARTCIRLGTWPKGGNGEPLNTVNQLMTMRQGFRKDPAKAKGLDDAFNTLMKYARDQIRKDQIIPQSDLKDYCYKVKRDPATAEEIIEQARKNLMKLKNGTASGGSAKDDSTHVVAAIGELTKRLKAIAAERGKAAAPHGQTA